MAPCHPIDLRLWLSRAVDLVEMFWIGVYYVRLLVKGAGTLIPQNVCIKIYRKSTAPRRTVNLFLNVAYQINKLTILLWI